MVVAVAVAATTTADNGVFTVVQFNDFNEILNLKKKNDYS
jgi:hypothetical protein